MQAGEPHVVLHTQLLDGAQFLVVHHARAENHVIDRPRLGERNQSLVPAQYRIALQVAALLRGIVVDEPEDPIPPMLIAEQLANDERSSVTCTVDDQALAGTKPVSR